MFDCFYGDRNVGIESSRSCRSVSSCNLRSTAASGDEIQTEFGWNQRKTLHEATTGRILPTWLICMGCMYSLLYKNGLTSTWVVYSSKLGDLVRGNSVHFLIWGYAAFYFEKETRFLFYIMPRCHWPAYVVLEVVDWEMPIYGGLYEVLDLLRRGKESLRPNGMRVTWWGQ